jgi:hypothetical protein
MCKLNVEDINTIGNYVVVVGFNAQTFERIIFSFSLPSIIPQFMECSQDLQLYKFGRST